MCACVVGGGWRGKAGEEERRRGGGGGQATNTTYTPERLHSSNRGARFRATELLCELKECARIR